MIFKYKNDKYENRKEKEKHKETKTSPSNPMKMVIVSFYTNSI